MPTLTTWITIATSFIVTFLLLPYWIRIAKKSGLVGIDVHKPDKRKVAELGGLIAVTGGIIGILSYVAFQVFYYDNTELIRFIFAAVVSILIAVIIGLVDDILGWKIGLHQYQKAILTVLIALPMMVINAGVSKVYLPFLGIVDVAYIYPLLIIPIGIIGASNGFNLLAGFNGLEAGMGILIIGTLGYISWITGPSYATIIAACMLAALVAFFIFNKYPARVFPGDVLTYPIGTTIAIIAILSNIEKFALILFIPYYLELILKMRSFMQAESFGKLQKDGSLTNRYNRWYSLTHIAISLLRKAKGKAYEWEVVLLLLAFECLIALFAIFIHFNS